MQFSSYAEARQALDQRETSCHALVSSFLERIDDRNDRLNALVDVDSEGALNHARYLDSQLERGNPRPLAGLVLAVKDNICIKGTSTTCGSKMLDTYEAPYDATVINRLREAGSIFIGKANCDEFAMGSSNETSFHGPVSHPLAEDYVPGGSSGGAAAAVKAGFCHAALGSDTGGSIRQPAAFCGVAGLKPTYGRVSRYGLVSYASSLDTIGPIASSPEDLALIMNTICGQDGEDATSADVDVPDYSEALSEDIRGVRIGIPVEYMQHDELDSSIRKQLLRVVSRLEEVGAEVRRVSLSHSKYALPAYYALATAEASSNLARFDGVRYGHHPGDSGNASFDEVVSQARAEGFGDEVKRRILLGTYVLSEGFHDKYYDKACRIRSLIRHDYLAAFDEVDLLLSPVTPSSAFKKGSKAAPIDFYRGDVFTVAPSLAGIPALSIPIGTHEHAPHLPVAAQLLGRHFDEALLLQVGYAAMKLTSKEEAVPA